MVLPKVNLIVYEAGIFGQTLDQTVTQIHTVAHRALTASFEKQNEGAEAWSEENTGISRGQYVDYIREELMVQDRALSTMTFALMETQLLGFIKMIKKAFLAPHFQRRKESTTTFALMETQLLGFVKMIKKAFLAPHFQRHKEKCGKKGDGELLRLVAEYRECYDIDLKGLDGFKTCQEIILARNACIHEDCAPSKHYMRQTAHRFLVDDRLLLKPETLAMAVTDMNAFAGALVSVSRKRIDAVKAAKAEEA